VLDAGLAYESLTVRTATHRERVAALQQRSLPGGMASKDTPPSEPGHATPESGDAK
jgi:hypothetical protein